MSPVINVIVVSTIRYEAFLFMGGIKVRFVSALFPGAHPTSTPTGRSEWKGLQHESHHPAAARRAAAYTPAAVPLADTSVAREGDGDRTLALPFFNRLTDGQITEVCQSLRASLVQTRSASAGRRT